MQHRAARKRERERERRTEEANRRERAKSKPPTQLDRQPASRTRKRNGIKRIRNKRARRRSTTTTTTMRERESEANRRTKTERECVRGMEETLCSSGRIERPLLILLASSRRRSFFLFLNFSASRPDYVAASDAYFSPHPRIRRERGLDSTMSEMSNNRCCSQAESDTLGKNVELNHGYTISHKISGPSLRTPGGGRAGRPTCRQLQTAQGKAVVPRVVQFLNLSLCTLSLPSHFLFLSLAPFPCCCL